MVGEIILQVVISLPFVADITIHQVALTLLLVGEQTTLLVEVTEQPSVGGQETLLVDVMLLCLGGVIIRLQFTFTQRFRVGYLIHLQVIPPQSAGGVQTHQVQIPPQSAEGVQTHQVVISPQSAGGKVIHLPMTMQL